MIDHLKDMVDSIVNRTIESRDMFTLHKEIYRELEKLSPDEFEESHRREFALARAGIERLSNLNKHETLNIQMVTTAAIRLRSVLDHYRGPKPTPPQGTTHVNFNTIQGDQHVGDKINIGGNVTGSAVGSHAKLKARDIVTQIQQSGLLGEDIGQAFAKAAEELEKAQISEGDKEDVADYLEKLKKELEKQTKDEGRIKTIWDRINGIASTVATALSAAASIGQIVLGSGS
jgi:molybdopterin converting factor small subunit